jgi:ActR/RegA family two-component response regulator
MTERLRLLFVDDERSIRLTLPPILEMHGIEVTVAATVPEALAIINRQSFDVLLSDLNIGQPGDGFVVVSAMRRTQPEAVTIIITGFPAFESALEAIRNQVDDYVIKPAEIPKLVETIRQKAFNRPPYRSVALKRVSAIIHDQQENILRQWLAAAAASPELHRLQLPKQAWPGQMLGMLLATLEAAESRRAEPEQAAIAAAVAYGQQRRDHGFTASMIVEEIRLLLHVIGATAQNNLLAVDVSQLIPDLLCIANYLNLLLREALRPLASLSEAASA